MVAAVSAAQHVVVMGVSGSGKTTTGTALAEAIGWRFVEGDSFHPAENLRKMAEGIPLDDADRAPWLHALADQIAAAEARGECLVIGCSALKRSYRDILRGGAPRVRFLHIDGPREVLARRLAQRSGHFFPPRLLDSQLATLEPLAADEDGAVVDLSLPVKDQVRIAVDLLDLS